MMKDMDPKGDISALGSAKGRDAIGGATAVNDNVKKNESITGESEKLAPAGNAESNGLMDNDHEKRVDRAPAFKVGSPGTKLPEGSSPPMKKGYGLRKWRRIKRDLVKEGTTSLDGGKAMKRALPGFGSANPPSKPSHSASHDAKQESGGSRGSVNLPKLDEFRVGGLSNESGFALGQVFSVGTDSDNSEDRSSKSSTAASAPKTMTVDSKHRLKNSGGKAFGSAVQRMQQGKTHVEGAKKARGERIKIKKEKPSSSMESDSRSSNFVFSQGVFSVVNSTKQSGTSMNYDGEYTEGDQTEDIKEHEGQASGEGLQNDSAPEVSSVSKREKNGNHRPLEGDSLFDSIRGLASVQEVLEKELEKFREIGRRPLAPNGKEETRGSVAGDSQERSSPEQMSDENLVLHLKQNTKWLEQKLEEARAMLEAKESRILELTNPKPQREYQDMESKLEGLFQQRIEAEVEYLMLTMTIQKLKVAAGEPNSLLGKQHASDKLSEAECEAAALAEQKEESRIGQGEIVETDVLNMRRVVCKFTSCAFIQLVSLVLFVWLFFLQFSGHSEVVLPT